MKKIERIENAPSDSCFQIDFFPKIRENNFVHIFMVPDNKNPKDLWWQPGLVLFVKLSGWIAGPIIAGVFIGRWLDKKYHTDPWLFLLIVGIAFLFSTIGIVRESLKEMKRIEDENKKDKDKK